jgi:hypothetical protein
MPPSAFPERISTMTLFPKIRRLLAAAVLLAVPAFAVGSLVLGGVRAATVALDADDPIAAGCRVLAPQEPAAAPVVALADAEEEVVATAWVFASKGNPSPWQGGGSKTSTGVAGPGSCKHGVQVTFTCSVTGSNTNAPPSLSCTFYDGATSLGTVNLTVPGSGQTSTGSLNCSFSSTGNHSITCKYNGDYNDMPSTSSAIVCTVN